MIVKHLDGDIQGGSLNDDIIESIQDDSKTHLSIARYIGMGISVH
jgi:hypothetical protein